MLYAEICLFMWKNLISSETLFVSKCKINGFFKNQTVLV